MGRHWSEGLLWALDTETTGLDPQGDRLVSVALVCVAPDGRAVHPSYTTVIDPGIEVPEAASQVNGLTTDVVRREGIPPAAALRSVARLLRRIAGPLVVMNAVFDLQFVMAEWKRHGVTHAGFPPIFDPLVVDRRLDRYRKGGRRLAALCAHYGVPLTGAHTAGADAVAAAQVARAIVRRYASQLEEASAWSLHEAQRLWHAEWQADFNAYAAMQGRRERSIGHWPVGNPVREVEAGA